MKIHSISYGRWSSTGDSLKRSLKTMKELLEFAPRFLNNVKQIGSHLQNARNYLEKNDLDNTIWHLKCVKMILENEVDQIDQLTKLMKVGIETEEDKQQEEPETHDN